MQKPKHLQPPISANQCSTGTNKRPWKSVHHNNPITPQQAHVSCSLNNADMPKSKTMCTISKQYQFSWLKATTMNHHNAKVLLKNLTTNSDNSIDSGASVFPVQSCLLSKICLAWVIPLSEIPWMHSRRFF